MRVISRADPQIHPLPNRPTAQRMARGTLIELPAIGTEQEPARAGGRMFRRLTTIDRMRRDGSLSPRQADAGLKLRDDFELGVCGARDAPSGHSTQFGWHFTLAQLEAVRRWHFAIEALGPRLAAIVRPICIGIPGGGDVSIADLARLSGHNRQEISGQLKLGLDMLADHYGLA